MRQNIWIKYCRKLFADRGTIFGPNKIPNCKINWMCKRLLDKEYAPQIGKNRTLISQITIRCQSRVQFEFPSSVVRKSMTKSLTTKPNVRTDLKQDLSIILQAAILDALSVSAMEGIKTPLILLALRVLHPLGIWLCVVQKRRPQKCFCLVRS